MPERSRRGVAVRWLAGVVVCSVAYLTVAVGGTQANWTTAATIPGTTMSTGRVDLRVDGNNSLTGFAGLDANGLVPGRSVAAVLTVGNQGNVPLDYVVEVTGSNPDGNRLIDALSITVTGAQQVTAGDGGSTCGGAAITAPRALAPAATDKVCVQATLPVGADPKVAASSTALTVTARATVGGWSDAAPVTGSLLRTVALTAPTLSCGPVGLGLVTINWTEVPGATQYRIYLGTGLLTTVPAGTLTHVLTNLIGTVRVQAVFGSTWVSPMSNSLGLDALLGSCG